MPDEVMEQTTGETGGGRMKLAAAYTEREALEEVAKAAKRCTCGAPKSALILLDTYKGVE